MNFFLIFFQALCFYLLPVFVGSGLVLLFERNKEEKHKSWSEVVVDLGRFFAVGLLIIFISALLLHYTKQLFSSLEFYSALRNLCFFYIVASSVLNVWNFRRTLRNLPKVQIGSILTVLLIFVVCLISFGIWSWRSPYPLNWDMYEHQTLVNLIQSSHYSFFTSEISDTFGFNSYPPVFHTLMAVTQFKNHQPEELLLYWNFAAFLHLCTVSIGAYIFSYSLTKNKLTAFVCCLLGTMVFESAMAFTSFFLLPQTLSAVIFAFALSHVFIKEKKEKLSYFTAMVWTLILVLNHYVVGSLAAAIFICAFILRKFPATTSKLKETLALPETVLVLIVVGIFGSFFLNLSFLNHGEAASYIFDLPTKIEYIRRFYGFLPFVFIPIGVLSLVKLNNWKTNFILLVSLGFLAILISNFPYSFKFFTLAGLLFNFIIAQGISSILFKIRNTFFKVLSLVIFFLILVVFLVVNSNYWKNGLSIDQEYGHISKDDVQSMNFIFREFDFNNVLIISDPATQYIFSSLTHKNSPGGAFMDKINREKLSQIKLSDQNMSFLLLSSINSKVEERSKIKLVVFSGRFLRWLEASEAQRYSFSYNQWQTVRLSAQNLQSLKTFSVDKMHFKLLDANDSNYIYEVLE